MRNCWLPCLGQMGNFKVTLLELTALKFSNAWPRGPQARHLRLKWHCGKSLITMAVVTVTIRMQIAAKRRESFVRTAFLKSPY